MKTPACSGTVPRARKSAPRNSGNLSRLFRRKYHFTQTTQLGDLWKTLPTTPKELLFPFVRDRWVVAGLRISPAVRIVPQEGFRVALASCPCLRKLWIPNALARCQCHNALPEEFARCCDTTAPRLHGWR
jgi:hypothetical protein